MDGRTDEWTDQLTDIPYDRRTDYLCHQFVLFQLRYIQQRLEELSTISLIPRAIDLEPNVRIPKMSS